MSFNSGSAAIHRKFNLELGGSLISEPLPAIFSNVVLLVHGSGAPGGVSFPDSSSFNLAPTIVGAVTTETDASALEGSAIRTPATASLVQADVRYSSTFALINEAITFEFFFEPIDQSGTITIGSVGHFAIAGMWNAAVPVASVSFGGLTPLTRMAVFSSPSLISPFASTPQRFFFSASRNAGASQNIVCRINGVPIGMLASSQAVNVIRIGTPASTSFSTGAFVEQVRVTRNQNLYPNPLATYSVPTAPFPNF